MFEKMAIFQKAYGTVLFGGTSTTKISENLLKQGKKIQKLNNNNKVWTQYSDSKLS